MYAPTTSKRFDAVSRRELNEAFQCCLTSESADPSCEAYREEYGDFLYDVNFKHRIGACGVNWQASNHVSTQQQKATDSKEHNSAKLEPVLHPH